MRATEMGSVASLRSSKSKAAHVGLGSFASLPRTARLRRMSAMPPIATESVGCNEPTRCANCGLMHRSKHGILFDHLVGAGEQRRRNFDAERLGRGQVHNEIEFGRLLDRAVGR